VVVFQPKGRWQCDNGPCRGVDGEVEVAVLLSPMGQPRCAVIEFQHRFLL